MGERAGFEHEHGYCLYPPLGSEAGEEVDDESEEASIDEPPPRVFALVNRTRARRVAVSVERSSGEQTEESNSAGDPGWFQNSVGAFSEYPARVRTEES
jgi:hypothetical protein